MIYILVLQILNFCIQTKDFWYAMMTLIIWNHGILSFQHYKYALSVFVYLSPLIYVTNILFQHQNNQTLMCSSSSSTWYENLVPIPTLDNEHFLQFLRESPFWQRVSFSQIHLMMLLQTCINACSYCKYLQNTSLNVIVPVFFISLYNKCYPLDISSHFPSGMNFFLWLLCTDVSIWLTGSSLLSFWCLITYQYGQRMKVSTLVCILIAMFTELNLSVFQQSQIIPNYIHYPLEHRTFSCTTKFYKYKLNDADILWLRK